MDKEYIEREVAVAEIEKQYIQYTQENGVSDWGAGLFRGRNIVKYQIPAANIIIPVPGVWEDDIDDVKWRNSLIKKNCSVCKKRPPFDKEKREFILSKYCPNCGAPMDLRSRG